MWVIRIFFCHDPSPPETYTDCLPLSLQAALPSLLTGWASLPPPVTRRLPTPPAWAARCASCSGPSGSRKSRTSSPRWREPTSWSTTARGPSPGPSTCSEPRAIALLGGATKCSAPSSPSATWACPPSPAPTRRHRGGTSPADPPHAGHTHGNSGRQGGTGHRRHARYRSRDRGSVVGGGGRPEERG